MSVADAIARKNFRRELDREKNRATHLPSLASRLAVKISADDIYSLAFFLVDNDDPLRFNPEKYGCDCRRLFGDLEGLSVYANLLEAAGLPGGTDLLARKADADWPSFDRERTSTDLCLIDLCEKVRGNDDLIDLDENPDAECWQPSAALAAELDRLTDEAEATRAKERADEIAADQAECDARRAQWNAEDQSEHAEMVRAGSVISLADYRKMKSRRDLPAPAELAMRALDEASRKLAEAISNVETARTSAELNAAIAKRVAAKDAAGVAAAVAQAAKDCDKQVDELMEKVNARAAEIKAEILSAVAERPQYPPPSNTPLQMPAGHAEKMELFKRTAADWFDVEHGKPVAGNSDNVRAFLKRADVVVRYNAWTERVEISKAVGPWTAYSDHHHDELLTLAANNENNFRPSEALFRRVVYTVARENTVDPALDRIAALESAWDKQSRLAGWMAEAFGVPRDPYHDAVGAVILGGMVRRIRHPGCKFDLMPVFVSETQGFGKSTLAGIIALEADWFTENVKLGDEAKELILSLRGKCVAEISEMRTRGEVDAVKAMISRQVDAARVAYGREVTERPRRNIFFGTTNNPQMLEDQSGNRRFLPVTVPGEIRFNWLRANVEQLVGEAAHFESQGETFNLPRELWAEAAERQEAARAKADFELILDELFAPERGPLLISAADLVVRMRNAAGRPIAPKQLAPAMRGLGFVSASQRLDGVTAKVWRRGSAETAVRIPRFSAQPMFPQR